MKGKRWSKGTRSNHVRRFCGPGSVRCAESGTSVCDVLSRALLAVGAQGDGCGRKLDDESDPGESDGESALRRPEEVGESSTLRGLEETGEDTEDPRSPQCERTRRRLLRDHLFRNEMYLSESEAMMRNPTQYPKRMSGHHQMKEYRYPK